MSRRAKRVRWQRGCRLDSRERSFDAPLVSDFKGIAIDNYSLGRTAGVKRISPAAVEASIAWRVVARFVADFPTARLAPIPLPM